jgi:hypothetical protein
MDGMDVIHDYASKKLVGLVPGPRWNLLPRLCRVLRKYGLSGCFHTRLILFFHLGFVVRRSVCFPVFSLLCILSAISFPTHAVLKFSQSEVLQSTVTLALNYIT